MRKGLAETGREAGEADLCARVRVLTYVYAHAKKVGGREGGDRLHQSITRVVEF